MKLFQTNQNLATYSENSLALITPFGICASEFECPGMITPPPSQKELTERGILLTTWENLSYQMECLRTPFRPILSNDMYIDECFAFIWRVEVKNKISISWKCCLDSQAGSCETGESLVSCIFENQTHTLSIGTEDEEKLDHRAEKNQWMPNRLTNHINEKNVLCLTSGLKVNFDNLLPGDRIQIHFLVAWSNVEKRAISTWTAVDQSYNKILQGSDFF